jgi:hypothetical protein
LVIFTGIFGARKDQKRPDLRFTGQNKTRKEHPTSTNIGLGGPVGMFLLVHETKVAAGAFVAPPYGLLFGWKRYGKKNIALYLQCE